MGLVRSIAGRYRELGLPVEDLVQEGAIGLLEAIDRYDPTNGAAFSTYAFWRVRQSITHALTDRGRLLRLPKDVLERRRALARAGSALAGMGRVPTPWALAEATDLSVAEVVDALDAPGTTASLDAPLADGRTLETALADPAAADPEAAAVARFEREALERALTRLSARQRAVIEAHFGLDGEPRTLAQVGAALHVSPARVRAIEREALHDLAVELEPALV
jgi:RNA polymerase primary sigma factor